MTNFDDLFTSAPAENTRSFESFDKEAWAAQKQQERDDVYRQIDAYVTSMCADGGVFQAYLDVQARFDRYSVNNAIFGTTMTSSGLSQTSLRTPRPKVARARTPFGIRRRKCSCWP